MKKNKNMLHHALLPSTFIAFCLPSLAGAAEQEKLYFYTWADYISPQVVEAFEKDTGIDVIQQVYDSIEVMQAKMLTGNTGYDLVITASDTLAPQIKAGVYAELDKKKLGNYGNLDPELMAKMATLDPGNTHAVPYLYGTTGVVYQEQAVRKALGDLPWPENPMSLLFDPQYTERLKQCGLSLMDSPFETLPVTLHYLGRPAQTATEADIKDATERLKKIRPDVRQFTSMITVNLASGNLCAAMGYSGDAALGNQKLIDSGSPLRLSYAYDLKQGTKLWVDSFAIPASAANADNALKFIDYILRPENAATIANELRYATPNLAAAPLLDAEFRSDVYQYPSAETKQRLFTVDLDQQEQRRMTRAFNSLRTTTQ
ncbi:Putrescine-binding periplasmic protein SpuD [Pseudomonas sp. 8AS]|uniref:extracellular solute-binding protein n=1 Tax=Pseudomonas sp. 8AS TaxID=2653163 RepID=UPI0012F2E28E|nr:extracellular solute-binding protein [Pseudomonas sp. 8AS]VXB62134.1 Putrescine-binding periplasmic protein SpuD [Pseudomonas sp. 8AS]